MTAIHPAIGLQEPPTVPGLPLIGSALHFMRAQGIPIVFMNDAVKKYGDVLRFKAAKNSFYLVAHPDLVHDVLVKRPHDFDKSETMSQKPIALARFLGKGILTANYQEWRPQRKLIQPLMHTKHITSYADTMARFGERMLNVWKDSAERDIHADMMQVTLWVIAETMFGMDMTHSQKLHDIVLAGTGIALADLTSPLPESLTRHRDHKAREINDYLTELVQGFINERRANGNTARYDLLSLLMAARDEDGNPMSDELIRDNILTLFFAGHETTANTLTWVFYYLHQHPEVAAKLHQEVDTVLNGRLPTLADLPQLPYTLMVIKETMRVEPTVAAFPRAIMHDTELGGYQLKGGHAVFVSPYILHRDPRWWADPEKFDPTRFSAENEPNIPKYAYLPFGGGPRICIGNHFALMEAQILLAIFAGHYDLACVSPDAPFPLRQITSSPKNGLHMRLTPRR